MYLRRLHRECRGASVLEFALVAPLLFLMVFATIDLARGYFSAVGVQHAAQFGARYASTLTDPMAKADSVRLVVHDAGEVLGNGGIAPEAVDVSVDTNRGSVTVTVRAFPFKLITPFANLLTGATIPLTRSATTTWEQSSS
jgi:Flp pilus assembly protein TadG